MLVSRPTPLSATSINGRHTLTRLRHQRRPINSAPSCVQRRIQGELTNSALAEVSSRRRLRPKLARFFSPAVPGVSGPGGVVSDGRRPSSKEASRRLASLPKDDNRGAAMAKQKQKQRVSENAIPTASIDEIKVEEHGNGKASDAANGPVDPLLPWIADTFIGKQIGPAIEKDGYFVLRGVLSKEECDVELEHLWSYVETVSGGKVLRDDPGSWYPADGEEDPWPHSGWRSFPDMFQSFQAGWLLSNLRETLSGRVFGPLYGTRELHTSKEGFTFHRPTSGGRHPASGRPTYVCGARAATSLGEHFDQTATDTGLHCIQSSTAFLDQGPEDGCFLCWPGSHRLHHELTAGTFRGSKEWVPLTDEELERLRKAGLEPRKVPVSAGDVILWRSDLVHAAAAPGPSADGFRAVAYTCMLPAKLTPPGEEAKKLEAYLGVHTGDHRPSVECWLSPKEERERLLAPEPFFQPASTPPPLTLHQAELYGLIPHLSAQELGDPAAISARIAEAEARGVRFVPPTTTVPVGPARLETLATDKPPMWGQDKWLGGMSSPCGRYIYGVPGTAERTIQITVATGEVTQIGPAYKGKFKWLRGVEVPPEVTGPEFPCGLCFALPSNASSVLRIDPAKEEAATIGGPFTGDWLWHGGNLARDGNIYAIPCNAEQVLKINPRTSEVTMIGPKFPGRQKWYGGIMGSNGAIYGIPQTSTGVLKIIPETGECTILAEGTLEEGGWKWHGGTASDDSSIIYGFPNNSDYVLKIDTRTDEITLLGGPHIIKSGRHRVYKKGVQDGKYKYLGGAIAADGNVYMFPCDAERVLCVDAKTDEVKCVGPELLGTYPLGVDQMNKFQNGFRARDGCVYAIPQRSRAVLRIVPALDPSEDAVVELLDCGEEHAVYKDKFEGGVMGSDGCIYCIPLIAKRVLKIIPADPYNPESSDKSAAKSATCNGNKPSADGSEKDDNLLEGLLKCCNLQ